MAAKKKTPKAGSGDPSVVDGAAARANGRPLFLDSHVDVVREGKAVRVEGGVMVDDTDLSDDEIDELTALRAIRYATDDEIARADRLAAAKDGE